MLRRWSYILSISLVTALALTACGKSGSNNAAAPPPTGGGDGGTQGTPTNVRGHWFGQLRIDREMVRELFRESGVCSECNIDALYITIRTEGDGRGSFVLQSQRSYQWSRYLNFNASPTNTANGFDMTSIVQRFYSGQHCYVVQVGGGHQQQAPQPQRNRLTVSWGNGNAGVYGSFNWGSGGNQGGGNNGSGNSYAQRYCYPTQPQMQIQGGNEIKVTVEYTDETKTCLRVSLTYRGQIIAQTEAMPGMIY